MTTAIERRYLLTADYPDAITVQTRDGEPPVITGREYTPPPTGRERSARQDRRAVPD